MIGAVVSVQNLKNNTNKKIMNLIIDHQDMNSGAQVPLTECLG